MTTFESRQLDAIAYRVERAKMLGVSKKDLCDPLLLQHFPFGGVLLVVRKRGRKVRAGMYPKTLQFGTALGDILHEGREI